jgi:hypothetical protein
MVSIRKYLWFNNRYQPILKRKIRGGKSEIVFTVILFMGAEYTDTIRINSEPLGEILSR